VVLAEDAAQVAAAEEDGSRPAPASEAVLLAKVREVRAHHGVASHPAQTRLVTQPVDVAQARAHAAAIAQQLERPARPPVQPPEACSAR
jgi:hypothetical protein